MSIEQYLDPDGIYRIPQDELAEWLMQWAEAQKEIASLRAEVERLRVGLRELSETVREELADRLLCGTEGAIARVINRLDKADALLEAEEGSDGEGQ